MGRAPAIPRVAYAGAAAASEDALLQSVRRCDFRFLLPDPRLGRVAILGEPAADLLESLHALGARVRVLGAPGATPAGDADLHDLVWVPGASHARVEQALAWLRPGGHLYLEARPGSAPGLAAAARRLGLRGVTAHWHWPAFARALEIAPLDDPGALGLAFARRRSRGSSRVQAWLGRGLARLGALPRLAPCVSVLARRDDRAGGAPGAGVLHFLEANRERLGLARREASGPLSALLVTPRFRASRHVVFLVVEHGRSEPCLVAKLPRLAEGEALAREAANLRAIQGRGAGFDSIPRVIAFEACGDRPLLVETVLAGSALDAAAVRRDAAPWCRAVADWLAALDPAPTRARLDPHWFARLVEEPLDALARLARLSPEEARAIERTRALARRLRGDPLPAVFEHGDLSPPNVLRLHDGGIGVLDWELAEPRGLPGGDLFFFLTWVAWARDRATTPETQCRAFGRAFFGAGAWARSFVRAYARGLGLPVDALTPLFVLGWARTLARYVDRLDGSPGPFASESSEWLRQNRYYALWRHSLAHLDDLRWEDAR
jgi:aminoglycoside phosphotransferase